MGSYIKIDRKILEWEWWSDINTYRLFTYMLLKANWKDGSFKGIEVPRGSFVSSLSNLSEATNLTVNEVRTALKHLIKTKEITSKPHSKFTVFTVNNYCLYQEDNKQVTQYDTNRPQTINKLLTTIEEKKEGNKERNNIENTSYSYPEPDEQAAGPVVISLILNDKSFFDVCQKDVDDWKELYPAVNVMQELRNMKGWCDSNETRRKTRRGIKRFINSWLAKSQNNGSAAKKEIKPEVKPGSFNDFHQRQYDYDALEKQLLTPPDQGDGKEEKYEHKL